MSLLLDALKKSGSSTPPGDKTGKFNSTGLSEMSLEELPNKPAPAAASSVPAGSMTNSSPRSTGENLFAAKKAPARKKFHYNLGIVPTAIIIGLILGTAGGIYVWIEIQPPKAAQFTNPSQSVIARAAPAPRAAPPLVLPPDAMPEAETPTKAIQPPAAERRMQASTTKRTPAAQAAPAAQGIQIQHQFENDVIFTTLTAAYQAYQNGDLKTAEQRYREVLHKDSKNRDALLGMAAISQQQGRDDIAMQYYKQVLILDPRDPVAQAGISAFSTADASGKESRLKLILAQSPQSSALYFALGNLYSEQSRWSDAQQAYFNAAKLEPANALFAFNLATSLDHLGQAKLAAQHYRNALQLDPTGNAGFDRVQTEQRMKQLQGNN
jgi:tetratricopeptide (TPR) repeat protein